MFDIDRYVQGLTNPSARRASRRAAMASRSPQLSDEDEQSIVGTLRDKSIGTLVGAGAILDLPGSMIRDVASSFAQGKFVNPFDQLLSPTSFNNRTMGRDLNRQLGWAGKKDTWGNAFGGFGTEVLLDPLTYMTFGGSALSKAGQAAKKAGLMDNVGQVAARKANVAMGTVGTGAGKRQAKIGTSLEDFLKFGDDAQKATAKRLIDEGAELTRLGKKGYSSTDGMGGFVGWGVPFMNPKVVTGTGATSMAVSGAMDRAGSAIRYGKIPGTDFAPMDATARLFQAAIGDTKTPLGQGVARMASRDKEKAAAGARGRAIKLAEEFREAGIDDEEFSSLLRVYGEGVGVNNPGLDPRVAGTFESAKTKVRAIPGGIQKVQEVAGRMRQEFDSILESKRLSGQNVSELQDDFADYMSRHLSEDLGYFGSRDRRLLSTADASNQPRKDFLRNVPGGTEAIREMYRDPFITKIKDQIQAGKMTEKALEHYLRQQHGHWLDDTYKIFDPKAANGAGGWTDTAGRYKQLVEHMQKLSPETMERGIFGNHAIVDAEIAYLSAANALSSAKHMLDALSQPSIVRGANEVFQESGSLAGHVKVADMVRDAGLKFGDENEGFMTLLRDKIGTQNDSLSDLGERVIRKDHADDLLKLMEMGKGQEPVREWLSVVDGMTNLGKGMWTSVWPAFHTRNFVSGTAHNFMKGMGSLASLRGTWNHLQGRESDYIRQQMLSNPIVRQRLIDEGFDVGQGAAPGQSSATVADFSGDTASFSVAGRADRPGDPSLDGFYSKLAQATEQKVGGKVSWDQYKATMKKAGVKDEELDDMGLADLFADGKPKTKAEIQQHLSDNRIEIEVIDNPSKQFDGYQVPGGDTGTYREILIKQPGPREVADRFAGEAYQMRDALDAKYGNYRNATPEELSQLDELFAKSRTDKAGYVGPHFEQENILAHLRVDDVTLPNGKKSMRVQEVQSDWHQAGRSDGYRGDPEKMLAKARQSLKAVEARNEGQFRIVNNDGEEVASLFAQDADSAIKDYVERIVEDANDSGSLVPDAPFKKSWHMLAMKQVLKQAAEEGYDEVTIVRGADSAQAVGGPSEALGTFYDEIVAGDLKKYTKRWGSFQGDSQFPSAVTNWSEQPGGFWATSIANTPATITRNAAEGTFAVQIEGEAWRSGFRSLDEAKAAADDFLGNSDKPFTGDVKVFQITDKMRADLLGEGQPLYSQAPAPGSVTQAIGGGAPGKIKTHPVGPNSPALPIGNKEINQWTPEDIAAISDSANFRTISDAHKRLDENLEKLVAERGITPEGASVMRLVFAQSDARYTGGSYRATVRARDRFGNESPAKVLGLHQGRGLDDHHIGLKGASPSGKKDAYGTARDEDVRVLLHEMGHQIYFSAKASGDAGMVKLVDEFDSLAKKQKPRDFYDELASGGDRNPLYHSGMDKKGNNATNPEWEQFAETFATSIMKRKIPQGAIGTVITQAMDWLKDRLSKLIGAKGLDPKVKARMEEIFDELGGFNNSPDLSAIRAKGASASPPTAALPPGSSASPPGVPPAAVPPSVPPSVPPPTPPGGSPGGTPLKPFTNKDAARVLRELTYAHGVHGKFEGNAVNVAGRVNDLRGGTLADMLSGATVLGQKSLQAGRVARKAAGLEPGTSAWNISQVRGVGDQIESKFGVAAAGEEIGHFVEGMNRISPFVHLLGKGFDPAEAAKMVGEAQVQYSNRFYTPFEQQVMKRLLPFYSFSSRVGPQVLKEVAERPGGGLATAVKAQSRMQTSDTMVPDYVRETASFPLGDMLGKVPEGTDRYLTGLGLMHEDPFSFGPNVKGAALELASRANPFIKAPLELMTGQSFFQKGPDGGRKLDDMDPLIGRLMANVGLANPDDPDVLPTWMEQVAANSPAARALSTARQLTDSRKQWGDTKLPGPASLMNVLTGLRITDVSPGAKDAITRELLQREMKDEGAAAFERIYFRKEDLAKMTPAARESAIKLQALANVLAKRAKERKARKEAAEAERSR